MLKSLVIRFSDYDHDTIVEHEKILKKQKKVYWGWWKKNVEVFPINELTELKEKCPIEIGIVNRVEKKCYIATCTDVQLAGINKRLKCPDKSLTPSYYSNKDFPAWLLISSIKSIPVDTFENKFFGIPNGEPTLFLVTDNEIKDTKFELIDFKKINGKSILHISDIHFGADHNYKDAINKIGSKSLIQVITPIIKKYKKDIGVIVASGDFVTQANKGHTHNSFDDAVEFLNEVGKLCDVDKDSFIVIPGNHDMPFDEGENPKSTSEFQTQFRLFRKQFLGIEESEDFQFYKGFTTANNWNIIFSCFNSAKIKNADFANYGFVGEDQYEPILKKLIETIVKKKKIKKNDVTQQKKLIEHHILNFCVIHHHLKFFMPPQAPKKTDNSVSVLLDAGKLEEDLIKSGIHFLLHGHQHLPYVGSSSVFVKGDRRNLNILSAGSAGSDIRRGYTNKFPFNSISIYTPHENHLEVIVEKYNDEGSKGIYIKEKVPYL